MHNIKNESKYYLYNNTRGTSTLFENFERLILYIQEGNQTEFYGNNKIYNCYLESLSMNFKDITHYYCEYSLEHKYYPKEYLVYDEDFRIIDIRNYKNLIFNTHYHNYLKNKYDSTPKKYTCKYKRDRRHIYIFRNTPVPYTKKNRNHAASNPRVIKEVRDSTGVSKIYLRNARLNSLKDTICEWVYYPRNTSKCWKDQSNNKKQWM